MKNIVRKLVFEVNLKLHADVTQLKIMSMVCHLVYFLSLNVIRCKPKNLLEMREGFIDIVFIV